MHMWLSNNNIPISIRIHPLTCTHVHSNINSHLHTNTSKGRIFCTLLYITLLLVRSNEAHSVLSFPQRVVVYRILPALTSEFVNLDMVPFVLPNVLLIAEECTKEEYVRLILPDLTPVFKQQEPVQVDALSMQ